MATLLVWPAIEAGPPVLTCPVMGQNNVPPPSSQKKGGVPCEKEQPTFLVQLLSPGQDRKETWHTEEGVYFFTCHFFSFRTLPQEILTLSLQ